MKKTKILGIISIIEFCIIILLGVLLLSSNGGFGDLKGRKKTYIKDEIITFNRTSLPLFGLTESMEGDGKYCVSCKESLYVQVSDEACNEIREQVSKLLRKYKVILVVIDIIYTQDGKKSHLSADWTFSSEDKTYLCDIIQEKEFEQDLYNILSQYIPGNK